MKKLIFFLFLAHFFSNSLFSQYDVIHYIPPMYATDTASANLGDHYVFLSTNETSAFNVMVRDVNGTVIGIVNISKENSK